MQANCALVRYVLLPKKYKSNSLLVRSVVLVKRKVLRIIKKKNHVNYGNFENAIYKKEMVKYNNIQFIVE